MVINNSGAINVDAITNGGTSNATGILVQPFSAFTPAATNVLTINNSGDIIARVSFDGWRQPSTVVTAIDVFGAPVVRRSST